MQENKIQVNQKVIAYVYGSTIEFSANNANTRRTIVVLPEHKYLDLRTMKVHKMNTGSSSRVDNLSSVKRTMQQLRRLIAANYQGGDDQLWVTLTYAHNVSARNQGDTKVVYRDFKVFIQRLRQCIMRIEYISVLEPQLSGRWHIHVLLKSSDGSQLVIPNSQMAKLWRKGFTSTKRLSEADNVASYVMAYVSNLKTTKGMKKGARLHLYPKGVRIYRRSRGIVTPIKILANKAEIMAQYNIRESDKRAYYERSFIAKNGSEVVTQTEFFNKKEVDYDVKSNSNKERVGSNGVSTQSSEENPT